MLVPCALRWVVAWIHGSSYPPTFDEDVAVQAKQEREAVRSVHGEQQAVRLRELRMRHALSQERRRTTLLGIVARATDESDKVKEVQFIRRMEAASLRAALDARLERSGERRRVVLANRQLRHGRDVDDALEDAQRRKRCATPHGSPHTGHPAKLW